jgi:hypothetical protein
MIPSPAIEPSADIRSRSSGVTSWRAPSPVAVTVAPEAIDGVQCVPGLSGGGPDRDAAELTGQTVVRLHGGLMPASYDVGAENLFAPGRPPSSTSEWISGRRCSVLELM